MFYYQSKGFYFQNLSGTRKLCFIAKIWEGVHAFLEIGLVKFMNKENKHKLNGKTVNDDKTSLE